MIKAAIIGGETYQAGELTRLLIGHPDVSLEWMHSEPCAGKAIADIHQGLVGDTNLNFTDTITYDGIDVLFCCTTARFTAEYFAAHPYPETLRIVVLDPDFAPKDGAGDFVYGLPELNRKALVRGARRVVNPGDFATVINLALLPLAKNLMLNAPIHINAIIGATDEDVTATTQFVWRNDNVAVFDPLTHKHTGEVAKTLAELQTSFNSEIFLIPMRGNFTRGILTTIYFDCGIDVAELNRLYEVYYDDHNFTFLIDRRPDLKDVVGTNKCLIHLERIGSKLLITAAIDNMLKGSAGNAVHNMNLLFGLHERVGLQLKANAY